VFRVFPTVGNTAPFMGDSPGQFNPFDGGKEEAGGLCSTDLPNEEKTWFNGI
jgi:hypothetical protein